MAFGSLVVMTRALAGGHDALVRLGRQCVRSAEVRLRATGARPLDGQRMYELLKGNTFAARNAAGQHWYEYHAPDGTLHAGAGASGRHVWSARGAWWIDREGRYCVDVPRWSYAHDRRVAVYETADGYTAFFHDGRHYMTFRMLKGDPEELSGRA